MEMEKKGDEKECCTTHKCCCCKIFAAVVLLLVGGALGYLGARHCCKGSKMCPMQSMAGAPVAGTPAK